MSKISKIEKRLEKEHGIEVIRIKEEEDGSVKVKLQISAKLLYTPNGECYIDGQRDEDYDIDFSET